MKGPRSVDRGQVWLAVRMSVDGELALGEPLVGGSGDRDRDPGNGASDDANFVARVGERTQALAVGLGGPLTSEVEGDEGVEGMHVGQGSCGGSAGVVVADRIAAVGAQADGGNIDADESDHDGNQAGEDVHRDLLAPVVVTGIYCLSGYGRRLHSCA